MNTLSLLYVYLQSFLMDEDGQSMAEYGLILALVAIVVIAVLTLMGTSLQAIFNTIATALQQAAGS